MKVNFYTSKREYDEKKEEFNKAIISVVEKGISTLGPEVVKLEDEIKEFTGAKYAIGVASGTDALVLASDILGFNEGTEVITSPFTFFASASCIARTGAKPVFVDIDEETFNIDVNKIEENITDKTKGILPVHLFLQMADMDKIMDIAKSHNLRVLEDAAEAFGMRWRGNSDEYRHAGTIGDFGIFSFFPTKTLGGYGDGGMIVTNDEKLYEMAKIYRVHGASKKYHHEYIGYNSRLDSIQAAVLSVKMKYINDSIEKREEIGSWYIDGLKDIKEVRIPKILGNQKHVFYVFNILAEKRDELAEYLKEKEIGFSIYYPKPLHLQECFKYLGHKEGDFPVAEKISKEILALPMYPELTREEVEYVCNVIKEFYAK
ncbi:DegT/DnrJ/EryC1/StrS family aminotransferase [Clostridium cylindrosporum]|uniref:Pleiotropic regulatory protein DegT n=1 Tax=Clostridium cylindrosporum DSM 605 TaxID=1121307 RepID=A0A0J8DAP5_CLOCY|nr:DegT/DnrJ/EryC1/StrS family aminotransferase [Clostridium cylindrosporum]KMT23110.1 pleiotropic regulatory protein DegT [Clostridium cylindrosporum DSM 605]